MANFVQYATRDSAGNLLSGVAVEVRDPVSAALVDIFSDSALTSAKANPGVSDSDAHFDFYTADSQLEIDVTAGIGATARALTDVSIGTAQYQPAASRAVLAATSVPSVVNKISCFAADGVQVIEYASDATGTALTTADGATWSPDGQATERHWGAGMGASAATDDTAGITAAFAWTVANGVSLEFVGNSYIHSTVLIPGIPRMFMRSFGPLITQVEGNFPAFTSTVSGTENNLEISGVRATCSALSVGANNAFIAFNGTIAGDLCQRGRVAGNYLSNFRSAFTYDVVSRTTATGEEGGVNWINFSDNQYLNVLVVHDVRQGSGTGNSYAMERPNVRTGGAYYDISASGFVVGDIIFSGIHASAVSAGSASFIRGTGTIDYGAQVLITGCQFDAGTWTVLDLPGGFIPENWQIESNNWGGSATIGATLVRESGITDRYFDKWESGSVLSSSTTGVVTHSVFTIDFEADHGDVWLEVIASTQGAIPGVGARLTRALLHINTTGAAMTIFEAEHSQMTNTTGDLAIAASSVTATQALIEVSYNQPSAGTTVIHTNLHKQSGAAVAIQRA